MWGAETGGGLPEGSVAICRSPDSWSEVEVEGVSEWGFPSCRIRVLSGSIHRRFFLHALALLEVQSSLSSEGFSFTTAPTFCPRLQVFSEYG